MSVIKLQDAKSKDRICCVSVHQQKAEREIKKTLSFKIAAKRIKKYPRINLIKDGSFLPLIRPLCFHCLTVQIQSLIGELGFHSML